ncbi:hypothetical protein RI367_004232 [Sorochytrium milnesiophthora]
MPAFPATRSATALYRLATHALSCAVSLAATPFSVLQVLYAFPAQALIALFGKYAYKSIAVAGVGNEVGRKLALLLAKQGTAVTLLDNDDRKLDELAHLCRKNGALVTTLGTQRYEPREVSAHIVEQDRVTPFDLVIVVLDSATAKSTSASESSFIQAYRNQFDNTLMKRLPVIAGLIDPMLSRDSHSRFVFVTIADPVAQSANAPGGVLDSCKETAVTLSRDLPYMLRGRQSKISVTNAIVKLSESPVGSPEYAQATYDAAVAVQTAVEYGTNYITFPAAASPWDWVTRNGGVMNRVVRSWTAATPPAKIHVD